MNNEVKKALNQLELRKKAALTQNSEGFPEKFYSVAEFFLTNQIFQPIVNEIDQEWNDDHVVYDQMAVGIHRLLDCIYGDIVRYVQGKQIPVKALDDINFLSASKGESLVEIFRKAWAIKRIFKELSESQHAAFISENQPKVTLLDEKLDQLGVENERLSKLAKERLWELLRRFRAIVAIYNVEEYKELRNELIDSGEVAFTQSHDIRYQGLSKCIYPGKEILDYNENFGMQDDKIAIQKICALAKRRLAQRKKSTNNEPKDKKIDFSQKGSGVVRISYGTKRTSVGSKSEEKKGNTRKAFASLFIAKKPVTGREAYDAISGHYPGTGWLHPDELKKLTCTKNDFNRFLQDKLRIKTAISIKTIDTDDETGCKKVELFINLKYC